MIAVKGNENIHHLLFNALPSANTVVRYDAVNIGLHTLPATRIILLPVASDLAPPAVETCNLLSMRHFHET